MFAREHNIPAVTRQQFMTYCAMRKAYERAGVTPADIKHFAMSHGHGDHSGNANLFTSSTLYIQRTEYAAMRYELTVDDPGAYTKPWGGTMNLRLEANTELFEYVCQQNNLSPESMAGDGLISQIVP